MGNDNVTKNDNVNAPNHYKGNHGLETIEVMQNFMTQQQLEGWYLGNALKYLTRHQNKNGLEDLKKARKNLDWLIAALESEWIK